MPPARRGVGALREFWYGEGLGAAALAPGGPIVAGRMGRWRITYTAGPRGVADGGGIRFTPPNGFTKPQFADPAGPGYCAFSCSRADSALAPSLWEPVLGYSFLPASLTLTHRGLPLREGDTVAIDYGWTPSGIPGVQAQLLAMPVEFTISVDAGGRGEWELLPGAPVFEVLPEAAARAVAVAPAQAAAGEAFTVRAVARDAFGNVAAGDRRRMRLLLPGGAEPFREESPGVFVCENVSLARTGVHRLEVEAEGLPPARTPPVRVEEAAPARRLLFGDPHCMSGLCVGEYPRPGDARRIVDYVHTYARDAAGVDFAACTSLARRMGEEEWREVREAARRFTVPGRYVALPAYEWFGLLADQDGNKNVYFLDEEEAQKHDAVSGDSDRPLKLWRRLEGLEGRALTVPHHSASAVLGTRWRWHDPRFQRLVEIYSCWGSSEGEGCARPLVNPARYPGQGVVDALEKGYRLGIIAGSDSHTSQPGYANRLRLKNGWHGGLAAVWAERFDREGVFRALWERRCYGTTGARIILEFEVNGAPMGAEVSMGRGVARTLWVRAEGTAPLREAAVVKNGRVAHTFEGGSESFEGRWTDQAGRERAADYYYVRLLQEDGEMAWSSPIWVDAA